ncbi:MAG TPA: ATP-binding cassette domain-containing protein, partial [Flavisolibacter sp.]
MQPLLRIENLSVDFITDQNTTHAVRDISLVVDRGEILAIVGESGSGKSVTSLSMLQLLPKPPAHYPGGKILFSEDGNSNFDVLTCSTKELQQ